VPVVAEHIIYTLYVLIDGGSTLVHYRLAMNDFDSGQKTVSVLSEDMLSLSTLYPAGKI